MARSNIPWGQILSRIPPGMWLRALLVLVVLALLALLGFAFLIAGLVVVGATALVMRLFPGLRPRPRGFPGEDPRQPQHPSGPQVIEGRAVVIETEDTAPPDRRV